MPKIANSIALAISLALAAPAAAQDRSVMSNPQAVPVIDRIPASQDIAYPGVMRLHVDATDIDRRIYRVSQTIPVAGPGPITLLYPQWLPGKHAPRGAIAELAGLVVSAGGERLRWVRDSYNVYAFHIDVPEGVSEIQASFQFLSPTQSNEGRIVMTPDLMNVQWEQVSLYPAGYFTRNIKVQPSIVLPAGWTGVAALDGGRDSRTEAGQRIDYGVTDYETLIDSPMFAGRHYRRWDLGHDVALNVFADKEESLSATDEQIEAHRRMVDEALVLFGSKHFDRYEFLLALTSKLGGIGLEHHRSSENTRSPDYFKKYDDNPHWRGLLPHEIVHSWNGKFRRPEGLWTPDYRTPMKDDLLWVYEGQTSLWDLVLGARSGLQPKDVILGEFANMAGYYAELPGREWRSVEDTTYDPIIAARKPRPYPTWSRSEDYYREGSLMWLAADMKIRELTDGARSLDDFAKAFFGIRDGDWGQVTYSFEDVAATLNGVVPYDWAGFLEQRMRTSGLPAPIEGITNGGYRLVWKDEPNPYDTARFKGSSNTILTHSLGLSTSSSGKVTHVVWESPAFQAGLANGAQVVAVNGMEYSGDRLKQAIRDAMSSGSLDLLVKRGERYETLAIPYSGGLRYPWLEKDGEGEKPLDRLLAPRAN